MIRRGRSKPVSRIIVAALAQCVSWNAPPPQALATTREAGKLELRQPVERESGPRLTDRFTVDAAAGQCIRVVVRKKGVDVALSIVDPAGGTVVTADLPNYTLGPQAASWIAKSAGVYSVNVVKSERSPETGRYEIELLGRSEPSERDRTEIEAQSKLYFALAKDRASNRESRLEAIPLYEDAVALWRALNQGYEEALCLHRIGTVYSDLGEQSKARDYFDRALASWRAAGDLSGEALTLNNIGVVHNRLGEQQKALESFEQALSIRRSAGDPSGEALELSNIALVYSARGEQQKALECYRQLAQLRRALGDWRGEVYALLEISLVYSAQGEPQKALENHQQALSLTRAAGDRLAEARTLTNIGHVYRDLGGEETALNYYQQALPIFRAAGDRSGEADTLMSFGDVYFFLGEKQKSLDYYQQSLTLKRAVNDRSGEALALIGIGNVYSDLGGRQKAAGAPDPLEKQNAMDYYRQALTVGRTLGDPSVQVFALMGAGVVSSALGEKQKALDYINQASFLFNLAQYRPGEGWAMYEKARVERDLGHLAQARALISNARDVMESLRTKVISPDLRAAFLAAVEDGYGLEIDVLMRLHAGDPARDYQAEALTVSERARARVLLDTLNEAHTDIREGVEPGLLERERTLQLQLNAKEMARLQMLAARHTAEETAEIEKAVTSLTGQYEEVRTQIRARSPHYAALRFPEPLSLAEIQKEVLDPDTLLLEYALGDERSFLWAVSSTEIASVTLPKRSEVEEASRRFHEALLNPSAAALPDSGKVLSRILLGQVSSKLRDKRLLIVADGALQYLPFAALPDPDGFEHPLIVNHEIVSIPSASTLAVLRREYSSRKPAPKTLAIFADPVFSSDDARISRGREKQVAALRQRDPGAISGLHLPRLPGTRREAAAIAALMPESERMEAVDFDASRATLTSPEIMQYRILHLATHGLLNSGHPELSGIVLSLVDREGRPQDGFLRLNEVYNLKLSADLVVLSACQTGLGKEIRGEGLVGLTRGFMYAGAPRVLASLWKVDDRATADLMKQFYSVMLGAKGIRPAAALRAAQTAIWRTKGWEAPYYWAAFVLQGDWN